MQNVSPSRSRRADGTAAAAAKSWVSIFAIVLALAAGLAAAEPPAIASVDIGPGVDVPLVGADARRQLVVTGHREGGESLDLTRRVAYGTEPEGIVRVSDSGYVTPLADGKVSVVASLPGDGTPIGRIELEVTRFGEPVEVSFPNQIVPIFTKLGCNGGGCHGKSGGQNGFRLSLLGFYPREDHEYLVKEGRGRRVFTASPEQSLLLLKATNEMPHGGGQRLDAESLEYRLVRRWMLQGMPYGPQDPPVVERIAVFPSERILAAKDSQQLAVVAHYSDGRVEDVTRMAQFETNDKEIAEVSERGLVTTLGRPGDVGIMVRFQATVDVFRATVPLGVEVTELPAARNFIDEHVFAKLKRLGLPPSQLCDDATFLRRVTIDLAGRLPTAEEAREFLADARSDKRDRKIDGLLASGDHADYFANKWSAILRNKRERDGNTRGNLAFHRWIRQQIHQNTPYDEFVEGVLAASGDVREHPPVTWYRAVNSVEEQVEDSAQLFLGMRLQCARCHHHPFEAWSQKDYYSYAAFFSRVGRKDSASGLGQRDEPRIFHQRGTASARNPRSGENLPPSPPGSQALTLAPDDDPRRALADWMADPANPFFSRALVNRYWKHFLKRGLVEPEDDMRVTNPPTNPTLLDALAKHFVDSGFDLRDLVRQICRSATYQLSAEPNEHNARDDRSYSRFFPRRLPAEVLYDALDQVVGAEPSFGGLPKGTRAVQLPDTSVNNYFLTVFGRPMAESACECERSQDSSLAQSLHLLNSADLQKKISSDGGRAARLAKDSRPDAEKLDELYHWAFSRPPRESEVQTALEYLEQAEDRRLAYEDIVWALINTKEFLFNH